MRYVSVFRYNNKDFTALNYLGLTLALVALALGAIQRSPKPADADNASDQLAKQALWIFPILTFFTSGTNNTLINFLSSKYYPAGQITVFMIIACFGAVLIGTSILVYRIIAHGHQLKLRSVLGGLLLGIPNFLSLYFLLLALAAFGNSAAYVFPIYNILTMLVSALAAWALYKERLNTLNKWGLMLAIVAIVLISYQELNL